MKNMTEKVADGAPKSTILAGYGVFATVRHGKYVILHRYLPGVLGDLVPVGVC
jgi:hypothetical protein